MPLPLLTTNVAQIALKTALPAASRKADQSLAQAAEKIVPKMARDIPLKASLVAQAPQAVQATMSPTMAWLTTIGMFIAHPIKMFNVLQGVATH